MTSRQLLYGFGIVFLVSLLNGNSFAEMSSTGNAINNLYENLLQREYAGPMSFPERVERKAQRSPSLRLRFGRSDPDSELLPMEEKRWFGDVDQKPIRSPSLRLRFGRSGNLVEAKEEEQNEYQRIYQDPLISSLFNSEKLKNLLDDLQALNENKIMYDEFQRDIRKQTPLRLRFGRSTGVSEIQTRQDPDNSLAVNHSSTLPDPSVDDKA